MIEMGKKYTTRDGRAVRILMTDMKKPESPVVGLIISRDGLYEFVATWSMDGKYSGSSFAADRDLIPVPTKHEGWMVFDTSSCALYASKESAEKALRQDIGTQVSDVVAHVTWED